MPTQTITRALAKSPPPVPAGKRKIRVFDDRLSGFLMEVWPSGSVTFYVRYRDGRARTREIRLGRLGDVTVDQARKRAQEIRAEASLGGDPGAERDRLKAVPTFGAFCEDRYLPYVEDRLRSARDHRSFYKNRLKPRWENKRLDEVTPSDVAALQKALRDEGLADGTVNRVTALVRRIFNLALRWEAYQGRNPAQHAEMRREHHREKYLTETELRALFLALDEEPSQVAAGVIALLAATGARKGEALAAKWEHIDFERRLWVVPRSKSGRRRHIPLSDLALRVLNRQRRLPGCPWVFPGKAPEHHLEGVRKAWDRVKTRAGLPPDLRIHDLRHTFASTLVSKGRTLHEVGEILGHSQVQMTMRYAHLAPQRLIEAANQVAVGWSG
ncbi:site-specific integrase [Tistrella mobilis]|uniref:site-specific integrase n=1 Tax=Tistrella mobilis TaxID=171437 RepID=UPI0031F6ABE2